MLHRFYSNLIYKMTRQNKTLRVVFIAAICFVFILSIFSYIKINSLIESAALVNHTSQVTLQLEKVISTLKDAETSQRGYLLTHDKIFLDFFTKGLNEYPQNIEAVKRLTIDNPEQQKNLLAFELLAQHREKRLLKMLEIDKLRTPTAAELLIGKSIMDSLRTEVNTMINRENILMQYRSKELHKQTMIAPAMLYALSLIALAILIISYWQLNKSLLLAQQLQSDVIHKTVQLEKSNLIESNQQQLQLIFRQAPAAIAVLEGTAHKYTLANAAYQKMTNRSEEQLLGKSLRDVFPEVEATGIFEIFDNVFNVCCLAL